MEDEKKWNRVKGQFIISNDFVFCMVMKKPDILAEFIKRLLPNLTIDTPLYITEQHVINVTQKNKSVRLDIRAEDANGTVYDVEMQNQYQKENIERRIRYYASMLDCDTIKSGQTYEDLPDVYIIFICSFDYKKQGQAIYYFSKRDTQKTSVKFDDGQHIILLNCAESSSFPKGDYQKLANFVQYVRTNIPTDEFTMKINNLIAEYAKKPAERKAYMAYMDKFWDMEKDIETKKRVIDEQVKMLNDKDKMIDDKDKMLSDKDKMIAEQDQTILALQKRVKELEAQNAT